MPDKRHLSHQELELLAAECAVQLLAMVRLRGRSLDVFAVPRGGLPAMYLIINAFNRLVVVHEVAASLRVVAEPIHADVIIDDLVDSGATRDRYKQIAPQATFVPLIHKGQTPGYPLGEWLVFPWEENAGGSGEDAVIRLLQYIGEDPTRGGLLETPRRFLKAWDHWTSGYKLDPVAILKSFEDGGEVYDEMVHVRNIPFYSQCEHHLAPFFGVVSFAYIPEKKIVGLSKMNRLVEVFARRLQVQERMTAQIIDEFCNVVNPLGAGITVRARHMCVESRGVEHQNCETTTSRFVGKLKSVMAARAEFFSLTNAPR